MTFVAGCLPATGPPPNSSEPRREGPSDCPRLDTQLSRLARATDAAGAALAADLEYRDGSVHVVIELLEGRGLPPGYTVTVEARYANLVDAWVSTQELCPLAAEDTVLAIRPPALVEPPPRYVRVGR